MPWHYAASLKGTRSVIVFFLYLFSPTVSLSLFCGCAISCTYNFTMHFTTLPLCLFTFFTAVAHAYPVPRSSSKYKSLVRKAAPPFTSISVPSPSPSVSTPVVSATPTTLPPPATGSQQKFVVAHHMVGNTYPYTQKDWADDIALAHSSGIDGFALNMGNEVWEPARVSDAYV